MNDTRIHELTERYQCSQQCAADVLQLRMRTSYTTELEAKLVADHKAGRAINMLDWPPVSWQTRCDQIAALITTIGQSGKPFTAAKLAALIEPLLNADLLTVGDRVRYIGDDIKMMGEHIIMESQFFQADGTVEYVTQFGAWLPRKDFELLERSNPATLDLLPGLMNRRDSEQREESA